MIQPTVTERGAPRRRVSPRVVAWAVVSLLALVSVPFVADHGAEAGPAPRAITCSSTTASTYKVVSGDSWYRIAARVGVTVTSLLTANGATTSTPLYPGDVLCLPSSAVTTTTVSPVPKLPGGAVSIPQFPVQGLCWYSDSWGAPRAGGRTHEGVDIIAYQGQKVYAVDDGVLTKQYIDAPGLLAGNGWRLTRADGTYFFYAHLSAFAPGLTVGSQVKAGQIIGLIGKTGAAGTPHLHFEVHPGGGPAVNPTPVVTAVNGCKTTKIPPQPGATPPPATTPGATVPTTTTPSPTTPPTVTPTVPPTTAPPSSTPPFAGSGPGLWQFIAPVVALDTDGPTLGGGTPRTVKVGGLSGVPTSTPGVMVRAVVENATIGGSLVLYACNATTPSASTLNYGTGRLNATMSIIGVSAGSICVLATSTVDLRIEVVGYVSTVGVGVIPNSSRRAVDTRTSDNVDPGETLTLAPTALGTPRGAKAVTVTVTLQRPSAAGRISIAPCGGTPWTLAYSTASTQQFSAVVRTNDAGVCITTTSSVDVVVDVTGVWHSTSPIGVAGPVRLYDSRSSSPVTTTVQRVTLNLPVGATRAQLTFAVLAAGGPGALYAWNCSAAKPVGAIAATSGAPVAATTTMDVTGRTICLASTGSVHAVIDLTGIG